MAIQSTCDDPAGSDKAVVFGCDRRYAPFALQAAAQIDALAPGRDFDICLASTEPISLPPGLAHRRIRVAEIETGGVFAAMKLDARRTEAAYLRLALPAALARDYRRLLYLDADIFVQGGNVSALLEAGLGGRPIAAVRDNKQWRSPGRRPASFQRLGLPALPYFNSGVQLIDVAAFREQEVLERCLAFAAAHPPEQIGLDQELINAVLLGGWAELSPVWNWQYTWASRLSEAMVGANIVHFIGSKKPWTHDQGELPLRFRRAYRAFLTEHYPDGPTVGPDGVEPLRDPRFFLKMLAKHMIAAGSMAAYLRRFPHELTVLVDH
ncbi:MAG: glycosyltransferase [Amaricoccus sp.]